MSAAPTAAPAQYEPFTASETVARTRAGTSSSIAELIAAYSPPMPAPVRNRMSRKNQASKEKAVATVAARYSPRVSRKSFLRPRRSVR